MVRDAEPLRAPSLASRHYSQEDFMLSGVIPLPTASVKTVMLGLT